MSENPFQALCQNLDNISKSIQSHLSQFIITSFNPQQSSTSTSNGGRHHLLFAVSSSSKSTTPLSNQNADQPTSPRVTKSAAAPVTKEELGRATWTFLHTLAAQYPDRPTRQQKKDVKELMTIMSRMYPCKECADHFKEVLRANPVQADSQAELSRWLCHVHNVVNRSLDKPRFPCERVDARWGKLDCEQRACDLQGDTSIFGNLKY